MPNSTGDQRAHRQRDAVQREMQRRRASDEPNDPELVETVEDEQRRERDALADDVRDDDED
jgi:hypothetical protein